ncbi:MAG: hypothetical protein OEL53_04205 [Rhodospirillales bacterium]|nr:hypothetical protein [Rhodospirillales bacterium]
MTFRLLVALSPHGFGHAAMTLPILNDIKSKSDDIDLILYSNLPKSLLQSRLNFEFEYIDGIDDFGLVMLSSTDVDLDATAKAYNLRHLDWKNRLQAEADRLSLARPNLLIANIPYLTLAAAGQLGLPALALSSLNWFDLYGSYMSGRAESEAILETIRQAHGAATKFLKLTPCLPMEGLDRVTELVLLGPSARIGQRNPAGLRRALEIPAAHRVGMVAYGGIATRLPVEDWPLIEGWTWLIPEAWGLRRQDFRSFETSGLAFPDMLASADLVVTKPGYGTFTEAACNGVAVLAQARPDWPETPYFDAWMRDHARYDVASEKRIAEGRIQDRIEELMVRQPLKLPQPTGIAEASDIILKEIGKLRMAL